MNENVSYILQAHEETQMITTATKVKQVGILLGKYVIILENNNNYVDLELDLVHSDENEARHLLVSGAGVVTIWQGGVRRISVPSIKRHNTTKAVCLSASS